MVTDSFLSVTDCDPGHSSKYAHIGVTTPLIRSIIDFLSRLLGVGEWEQLF